MFVPCFKQEEASKKSPSQPLAPRGTWCSRLHAKHVAGRSDPQELKGKTRCCFHCLGLFCIGKKHDSELWRQKTTVQTRYQQLVSIYIYILAGVFVQTTMRPWSKKWVAQVKNETMICQTWPLWKIKIEKNQLENQKPSSLWTKNPRLKSMPKTIHSPLRPHRLCLLCLLS